MRKVYYIGGSPCSGKSTVAEVIARKYDISYFKVDDFLDGYTEMGEKNKKPICVKQKQMSPEQIWMREAQIQHLEELQYYTEIFEYVMNDINQISNKNGIITEGAAYLPDLIRCCNISPQHYINLTPTPEFQINHFRKRPFVPMVLHGCSDEEKAFMNWMDRDILFANTVRQQSEEMGYKTLINDGMSSIEELVKKVCNHFFMED